MKLRETWQHLTINRAIIRAVAKRLTTIMQMDKTKNIASVKRIHRPRVAAATLAACMTIAMGGCASIGGSNTTSGALIGAVAGAAAGSLANDSEGAIFGAIAGALVGSAVGNYMDRQQQEIEAALAAEIEADQIEIQRLQDETLRVSLSSQASFDINSAQLNQAFLPTLDRLSGLMQKYEQTALHVIGHTDSTGTEELNDRLSRERAVSVAGYINNAGIDRRRFNVEGRGEYEPRETNDTVEGRRANRRVEIYIKPIVEGEQDRAFESPAYS